MESIEDLKNYAKRIRKGIIQAVYYANSGHPGGALSVADILTVLYFKEMNINPKDPNMPNRDRLVLSKGHASAALYSTLAYRGYFEDEELTTFRNINSNLQGHPDKNKVPGVDMTTGSLGQGLSAANGMALAAKLDNLCVIVDNNNLQIDGKISDVMNSYPIDKKFESFGFEVMNIDGNDIEEIIKAFEVARNIKGKPTAIIAKTIKGKGVSFMENKASWHGKAPSLEEFNQAINELQ